MPIVIFDLDGTLTEKDTYVPFLLFCLKEFGCWRVSLILLPFYSFLFKLGMISNHRLKEIFLNTTIAGIALDKLDKVSEKFVQELILRGLNNSVFQILHMHLDEGDEVILASASFDLYVMNLASRIGIEQTVCTRAEVKEGVVTGRILGKNCHGEEKVRRLEKLLGPSNLASSIFYTDHFSDYPLLSKVKKGILVRPGPRTRFILRRHHYAVLR